MKKYVFLNELVFRRGALFLHRRMIDAIMPCDPLGTKQRERALLPGRLTPRRDPMGNENQDKKQDQQGTQKGGASDSPGQQGQQPGRGGQPGAGNSPAKGQEPARQEDVQKPGLEGEVGGGGGGQSGGH